MYLVPQLILMLISYPIKPNRDFIFTSASWSSKSRLTRSLLLSFWEKQQSDSFNLQESIQVWNFFIFISDSDYLNGKSSLTSMFLQQVVNQNKLPGDSTISWFYIQFQHCICFNKVANIRNKWYHSFFKSLFILYKQFILYFATLICF